MFIKKIAKKIIPVNFYNVLKARKDKIKLFFAIKKYNRTQKKYSTVLKRIQKKDKISVGFYVVYDSSWGARPLFEKMSQNPFFNTSIIVCPDAARGQENEKKVLYDVYERLKNKYGSDKVFLSYDEQNDKYMDFSDKFDFIGIANPYDEMTYKYYKVKYLVTKNKLCFYNSYGYQGKLKYDIYLMKTDTFNLFWKMFVDNEATKQLAEKEQYIHGKNIEVTGCCKMDDFHISEKKSKRKTIIIAPHHTVDKSNLNLSNFLDYSDFIKELPAKYPDINFVFRPHPLLFTKLRKPELWGNEKVEQYIKDITKYENVVYSTEGEYFDVFNESDAMIDDCGSFLAEYFYTNKPQCYMLRNENQFNEEYIDFGKEFFNYVYKAYTKDGIIDFIENVVIKGNDTLNETRQEFAKSKVMINHPNVADFIVNYFIGLMK